MNRQILAVALVALAVGAGALAVAGLSPGEELGSSAGDVTTTEGVESAEPSTGNDPQDGDSTTTTLRDATASTTTASDSGYDFTIEQIEECGTTCRDVTAELANDADETRRNVRVTTEVYANEDLLWTGNETVGTLASGEAHTSTKRVDVGFAGGMKIRDNDGYVTIVTIVKSDRGTVRFSERRKVA